MSPIGFFTKDINWSKAAGALAKNLQAGADAWKAGSARLAQTYDTVSRPLGLAGLALGYRISNKIEKIRGEREQMDLLKLNAEVAARLRRLEAERNGFSFEQQVKIDSQTGLQTVIYTTSLPGRGNPDDFARITVGPKGIFASGFADGVGTKTLKQVSATLDALAPKNVSHEWQKYEAKPAKPDDPYKCSVDQVFISEHEVTLLTGLKSLEEKNFRFGFDAPRSVFDEHHGLARRIVQTNIPAFGKDAAPSDRVMAIVTPEGIKLSGFGPNPVYHSMRPAAALRLLTKAAAVKIPPKAGPKPTGEALNRVPTLTDVVTPA